MITLKPGQWEPILERIKTEYSLSVWVISWRRREVLGFSVRHGVKWIQKGINPTTGKPYYKQESWVYLDFYDDAKETFFRLKYL